MTDEERSFYDEWATIFYHLPRDRQAEKFKALLPRIRDYKTRHPDRAEPLILEAITLCTLVAAEFSFSALSRIAEARALLIKSIDIDPTAMEASAFITLGNLYFRVPGWPISFGDDDQALIYYEAAVRLQPDAVDANFFLGDFWLAKGRFDKAIPYLENADQAEIRPQHRITDTHTQGEARKALAAARKRETGHGDFFDKITPHFTK